MISLNNRLVLEVYKKQELKAETSGGFAKMQHKVSLAALKVLVDAKLSDGLTIFAGSIVFIKEEYLHNNMGRGETIATYSNPEVGSEPFHIIDISKVEMVELL